jgi:hypothetical protein
MTISVIVKGNKFQAAKAMADANVPFAYQRELSGPWHAETIGLVGDQFLDTIRDLHHNAKRVEDNGRFEIGSVLVWTQLQ